MNAGASTHSSSPLARRLPSCFASADERRRGPPAPACLREERAQRLERALGRIDLRLVLRRHELPHRLVDRAGPAAPAPRCAPARTPPRPRAPCRSRPAPSRRTSARATGPSRPAPTAHPAPRSRCAAATARPRASRSSSASARRAARSQRAPSTRRRCSCARRLAVGSPPPRPPPCRTRRPRRRAHAAFTSSPNVGRSTTRDAHLARRRAR